MITSSSFYITFFVHNARMVERIAFFSKGDDIVLMFRNDAANGNVLDGIAEFFYNTADQAVFGMVLKYRKLSLATVGTADVVGVHARDELMATRLDACIERAAEALILQEAQDVQALTEELLHLGDGLVELWCQRTVADEDEVIGRHGLAVDALHALAQVVRLLFVVDGHQYGILLHDSFPAPFTLLVFLCGR